MPRTSPESRQGARYAVAYFDGSRVIDEQEGMTLTQLVKYVWRYKPDLLATDNIFELRSTKTKIRRLLEILPDETRLVQVTGHPDGACTPLRILAQRMGLTTGSKLSPIESAKVIAMLASMGVGWVSSEPKECIIKVSRKITPSAGGMSMNRYERRVESALVQVVNIIKQRLDEKGIEYDLYTKRGRSGGGIFIVYESKRKVKRIIKPYDGYSVRVSIRPLGEKLEFEPLSGRVTVEVRRKPVIVGYDPGIMAGLAIIDLKGNILELKSGRYMSRGMAIKLISEHGDPIIIATDVTPSPAMVKRLAANFNSVIYEPTRRLTKEEKRKIVDDYFSKINRPSMKLNDHMRDALAAALKALYHYTPKFMQIEKEIYERGLSISIDDVKALVVRGMKINDAIKKLTRTLSTTQPVIVKPIERPDLRSKVEELEAVVSRLRKRERELLDMIKRLEEELKKRDADIQRYEERLRIERRKVDLAIKKDEIVKDLTERLSQAYSVIKSLKLEKEALNDRLREYEDIALMLCKRELIPLKRVKSLTLDNIKKSIDEFKISNNEVIYVDEPGSLDSKVLDLLLEIEPKLIIFSQKPPEWIQRALEDEGIPIYPSTKEGEIEVFWMGPIPFARSMELENYINKIAKQLKERRIELMRKKLENLLKEYRTQRRLK